MAKKSKPASEGARARPPSERRRWPRAAADWPLVLHLASGPARARLRDVSAAGLSFFLEKPIAEMTVLSFELDLGGRPVRGRGAVVRCQRLSPLLEHYEIAVFLHEITDADRDLLRGFVDESGAAVER